MISTFKKAFICILIFACIIFLGCEKQGEIENISKEFYYLRVQYRSEVFTVLDETEDGFNKRVAFYTGDEPPATAGVSFSEIKPCTYVREIFSADQYDELIGGYSLFEADLDLLTVVDPATGNVYTCTGTQDLKADIQRAISYGPLYELSVSEVENYVQENQMLFLRM